MIYEPILTVLWYLRNIDSEVNKNDTIWYKNVLLY